MTQTTHLSESERQGVADGSLAAERMRDASGHLSVCKGCAADVALLRSVMTHVRESPLPTPSLEDLWPSIRARIDQSKVVRLDGSPAPVAAGSRRPWLAIASTAAAAALLIAALTEMQGWRAHATTGAHPSADVAFANAADSTRFYEDESRRLLNDLEMQRAMQRAMLGPSASASLDGDLAIIDRSIAEQTDALARDPRNIALERLLAAAYREKVELLRRANNAG